MSSLITGQKIDELYVYSCGYQNMVVLAKIGYLYVCPFIYFWLFSAPSVVE